jgi:hypothetical protein
LSAFWAVAGLPSGFRRATAFDPEADDWTDYSDPMFSYGPPEANDIMGPWLWADMQAALSALKWTVVSNTAGQASERIFPEDGPVRRTCADALSAAEARYLATGWTAAPFAPIYDVATRMFADADDIFYGWSGRSRSRAVVSGIPSHLQCEVDVYLFLQVHGYTETFVDIDGLGVSAVGREAFFATWPAVSPPVSVREAPGGALFGDFAGSPWAGTGPYCPPPTDEGDSGVSYGLIATHKTAVCKWSFSRSN